MGQTSQFWDILVQWEEARERGEALDLAELCNHDPQLLAAIQNALQNLQNMQWMGSSNSRGVERSDQEFIGRVIADRYAVESLVGQGGFGFVYRCFDQVLLRPVAIKVSRYNNGTADSNRNRYDLIREAQRAGMLQHANIVSIHDVLQDSGCTFIVSDFIHGPPLAQASGLTLQHAIDIAAQISDAVGFAHSNGIIHCDIKLENILLTENGTAKLTDFGVSRLTVETSSPVMGTFGYIAPELMVDESCVPTEKSDVWALGAVLYRLLDGPELTNWFPDRFRLPIPSPATSHVKLEPTDRETLARLLPIVENCLQPDPELRIDSAQKLTHALRSIGGLAADPSLKRRRILVVSLLMAGGLTLPALFYRWRRGPGGNRVTSDAKVEGGFFDGEMRVITPIARFAPCTLEFWAKPSTDDATCGLIGSDVLGEYGLAVGLHQGQLYVESLSSSSAPGVSIRSDRWTHIAACFDTHETRLYVDGKQVYREEPTAIFGDTPFALGALSPTDSRYAMHGYLRSVRISRGGRYVDNFTPENNLSGDSQTVALYALQASEGGGLEGERLTDSSGNGHHGVLARVRPHSKENPEKSFTFGFHGGSAIETPIARFAPSTLEAWVLPFAIGETCSFVFGSDEQSQYGLGLALCGGALSAEYLEGMIVSTTQVPARKWSHLAVVYGTEATTLFLDGKIAGRGEATKSFGELPFVIGRLSAAQVRDQFYGQIRTVRISRGERYAGAFTPDQDFLSDDEALLIYRGDQVNGGIIQDLSGRENHGKWI